MYDLYTDGSCHYKDRIGGWAWYVSPSLCGSGSEHDTTISRMELKAAIMGLARIGLERGPSRVTVYSDSEYVVKGATDRSRARNANEDLWDLLDECTGAHEAVEYQHVRGHSGHEFNDIVDEMAGKARKELVAELKAKNAVTFDPSKFKTNEMRVAAYLESRLLHWVPGPELTVPEVGGSEGLKRLRDLRKAGYKIEGRKMKNSNAWEYRMLKKAD